MQIRLRSYWASKMWATNAKKTWLTLVVAAAVLIAFLVFHFSSNSRDSARVQLLGYVPDDATSVVFLDLDQLRASPFLITLYSWAPHPTEDSDYTQFVVDTGFNYERDLTQVFIAVSSHRASSSTLVLAEGKFDRKKIEAHLGRNATPMQQGNLEIYRVAAKPNDKEKPLSIAFLSDHRVAISDSENLEQVLAATNRKSTRAEWQPRFDRLAGSPLFAVIRQDPAVQTVLANRSPQLANFIDQLPWISIAAKPEGDLLRVVAEGETLTDTAASQLRDFLQGIQLLAQTGLNDGKLRQRMNPEERDAYVELLKGTEIEKISRSDAKAVRVILPVTPEFLKIAKIPGLGATPDSAADPPPSVDKKRPLSQQAKPTKKS
jgi:hypothetical protein